MDYHITMDTLPTQAPLLTSVHLSLSKRQESSLPNLSQRHMPDLIKRGEVEFPTKSQSRYKGGVHNRGRGYTYRL